MISIEAKMYALLVQWVKRFRCSPSGWVSLLTYWCFDRFGVDPYVVFANPFYFSPDVFPVFYRSLFYAWRFLGGVALTSGLAVGSFFHLGRCRWRPFPPRWFMCRTFLPLFVFPGVCLSLVPFIATLTGLLRGLVFLACRLTVMFFI